MPENGSETNGAELDSTAASQADESNQGAEFDNSDSDYAEDQGDDQASDSEGGDEDSGEAGDDSDADDNSKLPFHKHPRWIKQQQEVKRLREENARLMSGGKEPKETKPANADLGSVEKIFEGLPERKLKDKYTNWNEAYKDIRNAVIADLIDVRSKQKEGDEALVRQYDSQLASIRKDLGQERFQDFVTFAHTALEKHPDASLAFLYNWFANNAPKAQGKPAANKPVSKVNKSGTAASGAGSSDGVPPADYLRGKSMQDIMDEQMRKAKK